ncbi:uncharacterized protein HKW66_Vig0208800 [Vigna angularis]|uniref:Uncharacterized protein n=1 Tax=Phaseolus angularis TaxID=3914 RepID=A0A8T0JGE2_PHAAN|nr:uncharacterized protein HKW66_Vig0208800 [Vigna angularis]
MDLSPFLQISGSETSLSNQTPSTLRGASLHHLLLLQNPHQHLPHPYGPPPFLRLGLNPDTATSALTFHLDLAALRRFPEKPLILILSIYNNPMNPVPILLSWIMTFVRFTDMNSISWSDGLVVLWGPARLRSAVEGIRVREGKGETERTRMKGFPERWRKAEEDGSVKMEGRDAGGGVVGGGRGREREDGYMGGERVDVDFAEARGGGGMQPGELRGLVGE